MVKDSADMLPRIPCGQLRIFFILVLLLCDALPALSRRRISDDDRKRKANMIRQYLKKAQTEEGSIRLVGGDTKFEGNVEILHFGKWGAVCDDEWGAEEAKVVCRQLGLGPSLRHSHSAKYGLAKRKYWMDNMYCDGSEKTLGSCRFDGWGESDCGPEEAAGVVCENNETIDELEELRLEEKPKKQKKVIKESYGDQNFEVRLKGGRQHDEGRIEVKYGDNWGTLCGDGWSLLEANVICKSLGLGYAMTAAQTDFFGGNTTTIVLSGVQCNGTEDSLDQCLHDELGDVTCPGSGSNLAGVSCTHEMADLVFDHYELMRTAHLEDRMMWSLQCAMEENCLASQAYVIKKNEPSWFTESRRLLRFTASALNAGTADFRPAVPKHLWEWHMCHMHYHSMEVFATFDVIDGRGKRVAEGHKASFCLEDNTCLPGVEPKYACANYGDQGVSVNCSDIYKFNIDCQWVDISELTPGDYSLRIAINPEMKVPEMSFENNAATCKLLYTETFATVYDCYLHRP